MPEVKCSTGADDAMCIKEMGPGSCCYALQVASVTAEPSL